MILRECTVGHVKNYINKTVKLLETWFFKLRTQSENMSLKTQDSKRSSYKTNDMQI